MLRTPNYNFGVSKRGLQVLSDRVSPSFSTWTRIEFLSSWREECMGLRSERSGVGCADLDPGCQTPHMYGVRSPWNRLLSIQLGFKEFADGILFAY